MRPIGYSTGALAFGDFARALSLMSRRPMPCVELSALRYSELEPLLTALHSLDLTRYKYVSIHAPSSYASSEEARIVELFLRYVPQDWQIVIHPDSMYNPIEWDILGSRLTIENMDRRKPGGRTVAELKTVFTRLPRARFCFDIGHARQCDPSMSEAYAMLAAFRDRLCEVHVSEVNSASQHEPLSYSASLAFRHMARFIPSNVPIIIESRVEEEDLEYEIQQVQRALTPKTNPHHTYAFA